MKFKPKTEKKWVEYHATRLNLIDSINFNYKNQSRLYREKGY